MVSLARVSNNLLTHPDPFCPVVTVLGLSWLWWGQWEAPDKSSFLFCVLAVSQQKVGAGRGPGLFNSLWVFEDQL